MKLTRAGAAPFTTQLATIPAASRCFLLASLWFQTCMRHQQPMVSAVPQAASCCDCCHLSHQKHKKPHRVLSVRDRPTNCTIYSKHRAQVAGNERERGGGMSSQRANSQHGEKGRQVCLSAQTAQCMQTLLSRYMRTGFLYVPGIDIHSEHTESHLLICTVPGHWL